MSFESNIKASFRDVKLDMISIKTQILKLAESQKELRDMVVGLQKVKGKAVKKKVVKKSKKKKK
tara:strand:+ start:222 stop:413 length:192 start_codon:yes stop_codon:yes gene_type:complete